MMDFLVMLTAEVLKSLWQDDCSSQYWLLVAAGYTYRGCSLSYRAENDGTHASSTGGKKQNKNKANLSLGDYWLMTMCEYMQVVKTLKQAVRERGLLVKWLLSSRHRR